MQLAEGIGCKPHLHRVHAFGQRGHVQHEGERAAHRQLHGLPVGVERSGRPLLPTAQIHLNPLSRHVGIANPHLADTGEAHRIEAVFDAEGHAAVLGQVVQAAAGVEQLEKHRGGRENHFSG
ncbi:MAG: hypothetical protein WKG07_30765 [Hymenobacter sp.]